MYSIKNLFNESFKSWKSFVTSCNKACAWNSKNYNELKIAALLIFLARIILDAFHGNKS